MRVLVTGAGGQLGHDLARCLAGEVAPGGVRAGLWGTPSGIEVTAADHRSLPVEDRDAVHQAVASIHPDVVFHLGAFTAVDACETDRDRAYAVNALGTRHVAEAATRVGAHLLYVSTDYVFDGTSPRAYVEWDLPNPQSVYGKSKLGGEAECPPGSTVVRTAWVCGATGHNMVKTVLRLAAEEGSLRFVDDQRGSPTLTADLAPALATLGLDRRGGTFHVTNQGEASWFELARAVLAAAGHDPERVQPVATADLVPPRPAPRPANSVLDNVALRTSGLPLLPHWRDGVERLVAELAPLGAAS